MNRMLIVTITAPAILGLMAASSPAHADGDTPGTQTGRDVSGPGDDVPPEVQAQSRAKMAGEPEWWTVDVDYQPPASMASLVTAPTVESRSLYVEHFPQIKDYYCGPASGKMIVKELGLGDSAYDGSIQDQPHIANANHMRTDINGKTGWGSGLFRVAMNRWWFGSSNGYYVDLDTPTPTEFKNALHSDVQYGKPFGADTVELVDGTHYNGHPNKTIGHWVVAASFTEYGQRTGFKDPATSIYPNANPSFSYGTGWFVNTFLDVSYGNGITW